MGAMMMFIALGLFVSSAGAQEPSTKYKGRLLADVLRDLQARGLPIVFTSAVVTADLRVHTEPRQSAPRQQLDDLLAAHALRAENGPGGIIQIVRADPTRRARPRPDATLDSPTEPAAAKPKPLPVHTEHVTVSPRPPYRHDRGVGTETRVDRSGLEWVHGGLVDDPLRAVQTFPRVSTADDYRGELAVRGSPLRHVEVVIDGVSTSWLQHTVRKRGVAGSLGMVTSQALEEVTLKTGAYPRRFGEHLGSQLQLTLREGSRDRFRVRGALGGTNATLLAEGPIGSSQRGSWLVAGRQSYLEWPSDQSGSTRTAFGFSDGVAKLVYDAGPNQQVGMSVLMGMSSVDGEDEPDPNLPGDGTNRVSMLNLSWRSTLRPSLVLTQRAYVVARDVLNKDAAGHERDRGTDEEIAYRADITSHVGGGLLEAGARIGRVATHEAAASSSGSSFTASSSLQSGYVHFAWTATPKLTLSPGLRVGHSAVLRHTTLTPWMLGEWALQRRWTISASAGLVHQAPQLHHVLGPAGSRDLRAERVASFDAGVEHRVTGALDWQVTVFSREESDVLREPDLYPRLVDGMIVEPDSERYVNALHGSSRGIELVVNLRDARGLSGSAAYSYGMTHYTDVDRGEAFWSDFDQRHALGLGGVYRFSDRTSVGAQFRASTGFPIPAYLSERDGRLFVADRRNRVRLPPYARLDLRAERRFARGDRRLTLFAEVLNVADRAYLGVGNGTVNRATGEAVGFTDGLFRRRASAGVLVEF
jgi:hypothetical protein